MRHSGSCVRSSYKKTWILWSRKATLYAIPAFGLWYYDSTQISIPVFFMLHIDGHREGWDSLRALFALLLALWKRFVGDFMGAFQEHLWVNIVCGISKSTLWNSTQNDRIFIQHRNFEELLELRADTRFLNAATFITTDMQLTHLSYVYISSGIAWAVQACMHAELTSYHIEAEKNGRQFPDDIFKCIFFNENVSILFKISLKFVPRGPINNIPSLA